MENYTTKEIANELLERIKKYMNVENSVYRFCIYRDSYPLDIALLGLLSAIINDNTYTETLL